MPIFVIEIVFEIVIEIGKTCFTMQTSSSAIAERPRNALSQLKSCQLLHNCMNKKPSYR